MTKGSMNASWPMPPNNNWLAFVPSAVVRVLRYVRQWNAALPIYITESGWTQPDMQDAQRIQFYRSYIGAALYCKHCCTTFTIFVLLL